MTISEEHPKNVQKAVSHPHTNDSHEGKRETFNSCLNFSLAIFITSSLFLLLNVAQIVIVILDVNYGILAQFAKAFICVAGIAASILGIVGNTNKVSRKTQFNMNYMYILILTLILVAHIAMTLYVVESPIYLSMSDQDSAQLIVPLCFTVFFIVGLIAFIDMKVHVMLKEERHSIVYFHS